MFFSKHSQMSESILGIINPDSNTNTNTCEGYIFKEKVIRCFSESSVFMLLIFEMKALIEFLFVFSPVY